MFKRSLVLLNIIKFFSADKLRIVVDYFKDSDEILKAQRADFLSAGLTEKDADNILSHRDSKGFEEELGLIEKEKVSIIDLFDDDYPELLRELYYPPLVLYLRGDRKILREFCFAVVGSRRATFYGLSMAERFSFSLSGLGMVIVSGLARGIDTAVHKAALKRGRTIAVLGSGLLNIYPVQNKGLAEKISESGVLISEFPLREMPLRENFPRRNRIISGLSKGVLIVEAAEKSGALITARCALEQNREVFALPGKADSPLSKGSHRLIKEGAKLVDCLEDILEELNYQTVKV